VGENFLGESILRRFCYGALPEGWDGVMDVSEIKLALDKVFENEFRAVDAAEKLKEVMDYCEELLEGLGYELRKRESRRGGSEAHRN
jgi:hypothetical protein